MAKKQKKKIKQSTLDRKNKAMNISKNDKVRSMNLEIIDICDKLITPTEKFNCEDIKKDIEEYIKKYNRLLYAMISQYIFDLEQEEIGIFTTNLDSLLENTLQEQHNSLAKKDSNSLEEKVRLCILKLWDHVNLAISQSENLRQTEEEFDKRFTRNIIPVRTDVTKQLNSMNAQLISLIAIFTAMSFLVFGGISSLDNIFDGARDIPIIKLMIIGCIWGLCIINLVFIFMFFVAKMTDLNIESNIKEETNIVQKYPLIWWSNLLIGTILLMSMWLFYIDKINLGGWFLNTSYNNPIIITIGGFIIILAIFVLGSTILYFCNKTKIKKIKSNSLQTSEDKASKLKSLIKINGKEIDL